jgi:hypothetical protein
MELNIELSINLFHMNIWSLNAKHGKLRQLLALLCIVFKIIVLNEVFSTDALPFNKQSSNNK